MAASQENANSNSQEKRSLDLLCDMQTELANAVDSVGGKGSRGFLDNYKFHSAKTVNRVVEGFIFLRKSGRIDSSKFLIRPVIEIMFRLKAVQNKPELFYRIAYSEEMIQDPKWFRSAAERSGITYDESARQKRWHDFKEQFETQFPGQNLLDRELFVREAADAAGLLGYYDSHYRTYCRFTHGALRAMGDFLNELTDPEDNRTMALSAFMTLEVLVSIGAESPNLESLFERLGRLAPPPTDTNPTLAD